MVFTETGESYSLSVRRGSDAKGTQPKSLMGRERRGCSTGQGGDVRRTTFGEVAVTTSLMSGMAAPQSGLSIELLQDGHF